MTKIFEPLTALTVDGKLFVEGFTKQKPKAYEDPFFNVGLNERNTEWQASKVRYPVQEGDVVDFNILLSNIFRSTKRDIYAYSDYTKQLEKGIDISHLSDRIEVVEELNQCDGCKRNIPITDGVHKDDKTFGIGCTKNRYSYIKLKPIQEEESQDSLIDELIEMYKERLDYSISDIKEKFTITRKQP